MFENSDQKIETHEGKYKNSRVFTYQGVWMLSTILKSKIEVNTTINIIDAFVYMRKYISNDLIERKHISNSLVNHKNRLSLLESIFLNLKKKMVNEIYFSAQIYDAY